jgi:indole-3-glycerol phosphate synthase
MREWAIYVSRSGCGSFHQHQKFMEVATDSILVGDYVRDISLPAEF